MPETLTEHAQHHIETGWSPTNPEHIRATCRVCGAYQEAFCSHAGYVEIRHAESQACSWLQETCCVEAHRAQK